MADINNEEIPRRHVQNLVYDSSQEQDADLTKSSYNYTDHNLIKMYDRNTKHVGQTELNCYKDKEPKTRYENQIFLPQFKEESDTVNRITEITFPLKSTSHHVDVKNILPPYNIVQQYPEEKQKTSGPPAMDWNNYHRLGTRHNFMDSLEYDYPSICTTIVIGKSLEGRDIKLLKISNSNASNVPVWIDAGIHAREWIAPATATFIANHVVRNFDSLPSFMTNKDWYILPVLNPDGYEYTHDVNRMWRKNRAWSRGQCVGVDLNRNFSFGWGGKGSSSYPINNFYRGPEAFSEPESSAVRDMIMNNGIAFKVYVTLHSYGQLILFPFACSEEPCPDYIRLLEGATIMSKAIFDRNGKTYKVGISRDVMYGAAGTSYDWSYGAAGIPYCYLIELRSKEHRFKLPVEEIQLTGDEILSCVTALMEFVDNYKPPTFATHSDMINIWKEESSTMDIMVEGPNSGRVAGLLREREIPFSIAVADVTTLLGKEQANNAPTIFRCKTLSAREVIKMDWTSYHRLSEIYDFLECLAATYPYICTVDVIGKTVEGRDMKMLKISNGDASNAAVWIDSAIHPREWISAAVVTYIANHIVTTFHTQPESVTNKDWYILPVLNPDGYEYTHTHDRMWRKNRARYGECVGVDLNRNFSYGWGEKGDEGSSDDPGNIFFRGSEAFSEPETTAVKRTITGSDANFKVFLSFHSYGEVIIFPWGYTGDACPDYIELLEGGTVMAKAIHQNSGHTYKVGSTKDLMYYSAGTSSDWAYGSAGIPYSYMIELRGKKHRFLLPKEEIIPTACEVLSGVLKLMQFVDKRCKSTQSCSACCKQTEWKCVCPEPPES